MQQHRQPDGEVGGQDDRGRLREVRSWTTISANTIDARPRGPNQPRNATVCRRACVPNMRDRHRQHPHDRQAERWRRARRARSGGRVTGPSSTAPKSRNVTPLSSSPTSSIRRVTSAGSRRTSAPKIAPGEERGDEARAAERGRGRVGERRAGERDDLQPRPGDQVATAGEDDDSGRDQARAPAPPRIPYPISSATIAIAWCELATLRLDVGGRQHDVQQRDADPVVQPALDVEPLADPRRQARQRDHRLAERRVGRGQEHPEDERFADRHAVEQPARRARRARSSAVGRLPAAAPAHPLAGAARRA